MERYLTKRKQRTAGAPRYSSPESEASRTLPFRMAMIMGTRTILLLGLSASDAFAQSTEAVRYINSQGIEIIQSRSVTRNLERRIPVATANAAGRAYQVAPATAIDSKLTIPAKEQEERDRDRMAILQEELKIETAALESKRKILQAPATNSRLSPGERQHVEEAMISHEKNIRALNEEIGRVRRPS